MMRKVKMMIEERWPVGGGGGRGLILTGVALVDFIKLLTTKLVGCAGLELLVNDDHVVAGLVGRCVFFDEVGTRRRFDEEVDGKGRRSGRRRRR